ncbi:hypothetical protein [Lederbergia galactosidilytica]|nr:hypothetical protein [Lederbergia galactosidilytica]MBP1915352.1 hypothetical protein [Lederbergia galactosidilytica]
MNSPDKNVFVNELGWLLDEYRQAPAYLRAVILDDILLLCNAISLAEA